jgi:hypothetical protein
VARAVGWLAGLFLLLATVPGCTSHAPGAQDPSPRPSASTAADGGGLRVVESGFQVKPAPPDSPGTKRALIGVVVENTSRKQQAESTHLTIQLFDAAGQLVFAFGGSKTDSGELGLPWIQPGGRVGMGFVASDAYDPDHQGTPVRMVVTIGASDWEKPQSEKAIAISGVRVDPHADGSADLIYTSKIENLGEFQDAQSPGLSVLYRDSAGKLVGGVFLGHTTVDPWTSGTVEHRITLSAAQWKVWAPLGADLSKTEVYGAIDGG